MLSRSQRSNLTQENPHHKPSSSLPPTKTPARQALAPSGKPGGGLATGGKGLGLTAKSGRVLGQKDGNLGKGAKESTLLFTGKPSTAPVAGPSCAPASKPQTLSPPPASAPVLPSHLRTPSPGLHKFAPLSFSPEVEPEVEAEPEEQELDLSVDREVEYAGASSADYDEPFVPDFPLPDFKTAGFGAAFRSLPLFPCEDLAEWQRQDEEERRATKIEMDELPQREDFIDSLLDPSKPMFPVPKRRPLASKPVNSTTLPRNGSRPGSALSEITSGRRPVPSTSRPPLKSSVAPHPQPPRPRPPTTTTMPSLASLSRPQSTSLARSLGPSSTAPRVRPALSSIKSTSAVPSRLSKTSTSSSLSTVKQLKKPSSLVGDVEAERELGIFGIEDETMEIEDKSLEVEEFAFEL